MRYRGAYKPTNWATEWIPNSVETVAKVIETSDDNNKEKKTSIKRRFEEYDRIDSDIWISREKRQTRQPQHSFPSLMKLCKQLKRLREEYEYNRMTSADFYSNPRIRISNILCELKDKTRFNCFYQSLTQNSHLIRDKTVLIVGSGTALLALFVGRLLARDVILFDSNGVSEIIEAIIRNNSHKFEVNRTEFHVIRKSIDEMVLPKRLTKVDVLVSDWVNNSLFHKSLIECFIKARDKWLKSDGLVIPDSANMYLVGAHDLIDSHIKTNKTKSKSRYVKSVDFWDTNVYGFDMTALRDVVLAEPVHESISKAQIITNEYLLKRFDLYKISIEDMNFCSSFELIANKTDYLQTFVLLFDVVFGKTPDRSLISKPNNTSPSLQYSTRPNDYRNAFRPTIFYMDSEKELMVSRGDRIEGHFKYSLCPDLSRMNIGIEFKFTNDLMASQDKLVYELD